MRQLPIHKQDTYFLRSPCLSRLLIEPASPGCIFLAASAQVIIAEDEALTCQAYDILEDWVFFRRQQSTNIFFLDLVSLQATSL